MPCSLQYLLKLGRKEELVGGTARPKRCSLVLAEGFHYGAYCGDDCLSAWKEVRVFLLLLPGNI